MPHSPADSKGQSRQGWGPGAEAEAWAGDTGCVRALSLHSSLLVHRGRPCQHQHVLQRDPDWAWALGLPSAGGQGLQHAPHYLPGECNACGLVP